MDTIKKLFEKEKQNTEREIQNLTRQYQQRAEMVAQQDPVCNKIAGAIDALRKKMLDLDNMYETYEKTLEAEAAGGSLKPSEILERPIAPPEEDN